MQSPKYKLLDWIDKDMYIEKFDSGFISMNPNAYEFLVMNPEFIDIDSLFYNENPKMIDLIEDTGGYSLYSIALRSHNIKFLEEHINVMPKFNLSNNPYSIPLLKKYPELIDWYALSSNESKEAIFLIRDNLEKLDNECYTNLCQHPSYEAIELLLENPEKIDWYHISSNPYALHLFEKEENREKLYWEKICYIATHTFIPLLKKNMDKLNDRCWKELSSNKNMIELLMENMDKIDWHYISANPNATSILHNHLDKVDWDSISANPNAISILHNHLDKVNWSTYFNNDCAKYELLEEHKNELNKCSSSHASAAGILFLEKHPEMIEWDYFSGNPGIFKLDYQLMRQTFAEFSRELYMKLFNPEKISNLLLNKGYTIEDINELVL